MGHEEYFVGGELTRIRIQDFSKAAPGPSKPKPSPEREPLKPQQAGSALMKTLHAQEKRLETRFHCVTESSTYLVTTRRATGTVIPTETIAIDGARTSELRWLRSEHGMDLVREGRQDKCLVRVPEDCEDRIGLTFKAARQLYRRGHVKASHPNFLRIVQRPGPSAHVADTQWALDNKGDPGLVGADVHALAAWTVTTGSAGIRVAVLDEGVDTNHNYLDDAVAAEADFVDGNTHARPDGNDAHGTACAGIIASQSERAKGLAPGVRLVAARIAKSDDLGFWIIDDFETADAIDWAWDQARADVLSNSWGGGPPADVISRAFERARRRGRDGRGAVIVVAAGNSQSLVDFPGDLPGVLTVGASNQWDQRKTRNTADGESWWGSNYGDELDLLAPGVRIVTTDIWGPRGWGSKAITSNFNGTSAAAPYVAATAALMLSVNRELGEERVREIINQTADPLSQKDWTRTTGHGRLNSYLATRGARRG